MMAEKIHLTGEKMERELAAVSYLWIFSLLILLVKRENPFIQHHARRGFVLFLLSLLFIGIPILYNGLYAVLVLGVLGFISAALGNENTLPILSEIADGTLRFHHVKHYFHHAKHGAIKMVNPEHIPPAFREELRVQEETNRRQEKMLDEEKALIEKEERKLSALFNRVNEDEKHLKALEDEVHELEKEVDSIKKSDASG